MNDQLAEALSTIASAPNAQLRTATVSSVVGSNVTLASRGGTVSATGRLASYTPVAGHVVLVVSNGSSMVILGQLVGA